MCLYGTHIPEATSRLRKKNDPVRASIIRGFHRKSVKTFLTERTIREKRVRTTVRIARVARLAERTAPLIVPNRPDERSATHGPTHGRLWAQAANYRDHRDLAAESVLRRRDLRSR